MADNFAFQDTTWYWRDSWLCGINGDLQMATTSSWVCSELINYAVAIVKTAY